MHHGMQLEEQDRRRPGIEQGTLQIQVGCIDKLHDLFVCYSSQLPSQPGYVPLEVSSQYPE
jgi:hypothetical protein